MTIPSAFLSLQARLAVCALGLVAGVAGAADVAGVAGAVVAGVAASAAAVAGASTGDSAGWSGTPSPSPSLGAFGLASVTVSL